jgi:outer membrane phospholipase A
MKKLFAALMLLFCSIGVYAAEYENPMSMYKDNYFLFGDKEDETKFQISAKYNIFYPSKTGLFVAYTQTSWWEIYNSRDFFSSNYQPEVFYRFTSGDNIFSNKIIPYVDYIQVSPEYHCSNGVPKDQGRVGINTYYAQVQFSIGEVYNFGTNLKVFGYYSKTRRNEDINDYRKNYEAEVFFKLKSKTYWLLDKYELHARCTGNPAGKGWYQLEAVATLFTTYFQPKLMVQFNDGYSPNLAYWNQKDRELRVGITF